MADIEQLGGEAQARIGAAGDLAALEALRVEFLGKQGSVSALLKTLGAMSPEERQNQGPKIHALREAVQAALSTRKDALEGAELEAQLANEGLDLSLPASDVPRGSVHPVSQVMDELAEIFADLGFAVATGPEIEDDWYNFTALNMPESHPARAMHDTFYFPDVAPKGERRASSSEAVGREASSSEAVGQEGRMLLRTHTSPVQVRTMLAQGAPLRIIAPGRVYRSDSDATHTPMFHQIEGLVIDKGIHLGHLKWTLETFLKAFFERDDIVLRLRPSYFPFTEPSVEVDVGFAIEKSKDGKGRRVLGGSGDAPGHGWMELLGSGMVNARVIEMSGLDPAEWQGFAFGVGVDRLAMLKYGMDDLRAFFDGDVRWLKHYGFSAFEQPTLSGGVGAKAGSGS
jgi:phenylalanyl-tRNA synthetase alpha chain